MKLFVGLGNPGTEYERNRHNVGFMVLDEMFDDYATTPWKRKFQGLVADASLGGERALFLKPQTYMNESGRAVGEAARFLKIALDDIIVLYDEIDLAPSKLKAKTGGGNAGHNGLRSISSHLGNDYIRIRIGVGHPGDKSQVANYVLNNFSKSDHVWLDPLIEEISRAAPRLMTNDQSRFLTDVVNAVAPTKAKRLDGAKAEKISTPKEAEKIKPVPVEAKSKTKPTTGSSLAENLKSWLKGDADKP